MYRLFKLHFSQLCSFFLAQNVKKYETVSPVHVILYLMYSHSDMSDSKCGLCKPSIALHRSTVKIVAVFGVIKVCDKWNRTAGNVWTVSHINYYFVHRNRLSLLQIILLQGHNPLSEILGGICALKFRIFRILDGNMVHIPYIM